MVSGLVSQLQGVFPQEPELAVQKAVADGLVRALGDEEADLNDVTCNHDYSILCPEGKLLLTWLGWAGWGWLDCHCGAGWADAGDGNTCLASQDYQGVRNSCANFDGDLLELLFQGPCASKLELGGSGSCFAVFAGAGHVALQVV